MNTPEVEQEIRDEVGRWALEYTRESFEQYLSMTLAALGLSEFDLMNLKPEKRAALFARYSPVLPDMSVPGPAADGRWNWLAIAQSNPEYHRAASEDMAKIVQSRLRRQLMEQAGF